MSLKKIFPLAALVIVLSVGFGYIKPAVDSIFDKFAEKEEKKQELASARKTRENFELLTNDRDRVLDTEAGQALVAFLQSDSGQERTVDVTNQLSVRTGVVVDSLFFKESNRARQSIPVNTDLLGEGTAASAPSAPSLSSAVFSVEVRGTYEGIRDFLSGFSASAPFHEIRAFSIERPETRTGEDGVATDSGDLLLGTLEAEIYYLPEKPYPNAYLLPVFSAGSFDDAPLESLLRSRENVLPLPSASGQGRQNPFVL
jgi:hypothetical protein